MNVKSVALVLLVLVAIAFAIHEHNLQKRLRRETESLQAQVEPLRQEIQRLKQQSRADADELERLRTEEFELARLRGEVNQLKRQRETIDRRTPTALAGKSVPITSQEGQQVVGDQLQQFKLETDGSLTSTNDAWISLNNTIGKDFRLSGEVWLGGPSTTMDYPEDTPDGFAVYVREWDGMHRYSVTSRYMQVKRRKWSAGLPKGEESIIYVTKFQEAPLRTWIPFTLEVTREQIAFQLGNQSGTIMGPLDSD